MLGLIFFILLAISHVNSLNFGGGGPKNSDTYGPYVVHWKYFKVCPNSENSLANISTALVVEQDVYKGTVNLTINEAVRIVEMKIEIHSVKNNKKKLLWDFTIEKPCQNRVLVTTLKSHIDIRSCVLKKGFYNNNVNFSEVVHLFFGPSFFYGEYICKFTLVSRKQDIACVLADEVISKIT